MECNEDCVNRLLCVECTEETCELARAGKCQNQRLAKRQVGAGQWWGRESDRASDVVKVLLPHVRAQVKQCSVFKTEKTGWGLKVRRPPTTQTDLLVLDMLRLMDGWRGR